MTPRILVVGAGFAGAVHARELAEAGFRVEVVDRRLHLAGNAFDEATGTGTRVHRYGPHLFHTSNEEVVAWLDRFAAWVPYEHRVEVELPGPRFVPLPVNRRTVSDFFGVRLDTPEAMRDFLARQAEPVAEPANAAEYLNGRLGRRLTDVFFRPYTRKMWALDLEELDASVVRRIPIREDEDDRYFPTDRFQQLPRDGYTEVFRRIFDHPNISVTLGQAFDSALLGEFAWCFNSMAIDEYFDDCFGPLPYRSIRFHHRVVSRSESRGKAATINFADDGPITRETDWQRLPGHAVAPGPDKTVTQEEPCDYRQNGMERYYPVKTSDGRYAAAYQRYRELAEAEGRQTFIGRCGTYQYLDMHQVINQSLMGVRRWIAAR